MPVLPQPYSEKTVSEWIIELQQAQVAEDRLRALQAIGFLPPKHDAAHWAAHSLGDSDSNVRALAARWLGTNPEPVSLEAEAILASLLVDADPDTRFESARVLIRRRSSHVRQAVPVLLHFLDEEETQPLMVAAVINSLVEIEPANDPATVELRPRIEKFLDHDRAEVREAVSAAIAKWPTLCESLTDRLLPLLDDSEPVVRENISLAFGRAGLIDQKIKTALETTAQDEDSEVARVASEALRYLEAKQSQ